MSTARKIDELRPALRLFTPGAETSGDEPAGPRLTPDLRVSELFEEWFVPYVLISQRNAKPGTIASYRESINWWVRLTGDPTIRQLDGDEIFTAKFLIGLRQATWKRGECSTPAPLSPSTIAKHVTQVNAVIERCGPTVNRKRPCKDLIDEPPLLSAKKPLPVPKDPIELNDARRLYATCAVMTTPVKFIQPAAQWQALISTLYFIGLRIGTTLKLRREWFVERDGGYWFVIPGEVVKRDKPLRKYVRLSLAERLLKLPGSGLYFPEKRVDYARDRHERLQQLAGFADERWVGFHAWRRTHGVQMALCGAKAGLRAAQWSLDHDDAETTRDHYVDIDRQMIEQMPALDVAPRGVNPNQRNLF